jgi:hypothetical protein
MARQPEAIGKLQTVMLIAFAFVELVFLLTVFVAPASFKGDYAPAKTTAVVSAQHLS